MTAASAFRRLPALLAPLVVPLLAIPAAQPASAETNPLPVHVVTARIERPERNMRLTGTIEAKDSYTAGFRDGGRVISVAVDVGDVLRAGDEIARVDPTQAEAALEAARASLRAAEAALAQAEQARERARNLLERGSGTQAELDSATQGYLTARAARDQARAQLATARRTAEDTVLTAVEDAIVTDRSAEPGQVVGAGQAIVTLASRAGREAVFLTPDDPRLAEALGSEVAIRPLDDTTRFTVPVTEVAPVVARTGTVTAKAAIDGAAASAFTIGEPVLGELKLTDAPVITVPWSALTAGRDGPAVWTLPEGADRVQLTPVEIEAYTSRGVELASGLAVGDRVVTDGSHALFPGRAVTILPQEDPR